MEVHDHFGHAETSTSRTHASPHAFPSSSSRMRQVSPTDASFYLSSRRRLISTIQAPEVPESPIVPEAPVSPLTDGASKTMPPLDVDAVELVPPLDGKSAKDDGP